MTEPPSDYFPLEPAREEFARVQEVYRSLGAPERCRQVIGEGGHRFFADAAWPVMLELMARQEGG